MKDAYSIKELGQIIADEAKKSGLALAEDAVEQLGKSAYMGMKRWVQESAALSSNKIDDVLAPFIGQLDPIVLPQIEKLDLDGDGK